MAKVTSKVPRGFTRFYALQLINDEPKTGKEIINEAERLSEGAWRPSPGLIYPLLGRLLKDGLVEENDYGKFAITEAGLETLKQHAKLHKQLEKQLDLVTKLSHSMFIKGKILSEESMDRVLEVTSRIKERVELGSKDIQKRFYNKYKAFLESELEKIKKKEKCEQ